MKKNTLIFCLVFISIIIRSQTINLSFTANEACSYVPIDSILIENLTKNTDTVLYFPDTTLSMQISYIENSDSLEQNFRLLQNYPNPFDYKTNIDVFVPYEDVFTIFLFDISGRQLAYIENTLERGLHSFEIFGGNSMTYILTVKSGNYSQNIKLVQYNSRNSNIPTIKYSGILGLKNAELKMKVLKQAFLYKVGDNLRFTGFYGDDYYEIADSPEENTEYNFNFSHPVCPETYTDYRDGYIYKLVKIGCQCWLAENLRFLPSVTGASTGSSVYEHYYVYGYNGTSLSNATSHANFDTYGVLYNWAAVMQGAVSNSEGNIQGVCPDGWLIPNDNQWKELEMYLGMSKEEADNTGYRGTNEGSKLAGTTPLWASGYITANQEFGYSGFNGLPGGGRYITEDFNYLGASAVWWTSTDYATEQAWIRTLNTHYSSKVYRTTLSKESGFSVRCVME